MIAKFYTFAKRKNSTKVPGSSDTYDEYNVYLKDDTSIINPDIVLDTGDYTARPLYNYVLIEDLNRYYFIDDIVSDGRLWIFKCSVDVLGTCRGSIGRYSGYVLRSSHSYNGLIKDEMYPTVAVPSSASQENNAPFMRAGAYHINTQQGCFVVGLINNIGSNAAKYGSVFYALMDKAALAQLTQKALTDCVTTTNNFDFGDASQALQNSIVNPLQYIASVTWFPLDIDDVKAGTSEISTLKLFDWPVTITEGHAYALVNTPPVHEENVTFNLQKHPQAASRGSYLNGSPFTEITLTSGAFGSFDLNPNLIAGDTTLTLNYKIDLLEGTGVLTVYGSVTTIAQVKAQIGVPIQLSQVTRDYIGAVTSGVGGGLSLLGGLFTGDFAGGIMNAASGVGNAVKGSAAKVLSIGSNGGVADLDFKTRLDYVFWNLAPEDRADIGRPYCAVAQLSTIPGYLKLESGNIEIPVLADEQQMVKDYLEQGFFYE